MSIKKVAILLSTYNGESFLASQLNSLLTQSYNEIDIYIRDDCSSDNTVSIINKFVNEHENVHFISSNENYGCAKSFIFLLSKIEADYYFFCDQDDVWNIDKVKQSLSVFNESDGPHLSHSDLNIVDENLNVLCDSFYKHQSMDPYLASNKNRILVQNYIVGCTICFNRKLREFIIENFKSNDASHIVMHDWWVGLVAKFFGKITYINKPLIDYRQHSSNVLGANDNSLSRFLISFVSGKGLKRVRSFTGKVSVQANYFYLCYGEKLSVQEKNLVLDAAKFNSKLGFINMFTLMYSKSMRLQGFKRNLALLFTSIIK